MSRPGDHTNPTEAASDELPGGLGRRFLVGTVQLGAGNFVVSLVNLAIGILLARWLGPEAFGLFAFVFSISELLSIVGAFSLGIALIQARNESQELYDTAYAICGLLGLIALVLSAALAPWLATMRGSEAGWFLMTLAVSRLIRLLAQVPRAKLERSLRYGRITTLSVIESSVPNLIALGLVYYGIGAWALVIRDLLVSSFILVLETVASGYRFRMQVRREESQQLMHFSRPMFVARSVDILLERIDRVAVGGLLGNASAGLLDRGRFLADVGLYVMRPVERASLNLLSRLQDDEQRLSRSYSIVNFFLVRLMFLGGLVLVLAPIETLRLTLGEEWVGAAPALRFLGVHAAIFPIYSMVKVLAMARNEVARIARISIIQAGILIPGALGAASLGSLAGVGAAVAVTTCVGALLGGLWSRDLANVSYRRSLGVPFGMVFATALALSAADAVGALDAAHWATRPFAVGGFFALGVLALERGALLGELRYLRRQLASTQDPAG